MSMTGAEVARTRNVDKLRDELYDIVEILNEPDVEDVFANPDGWLWVNQRGKEPDAKRLCPERERLSIINTVAALNGVVVNAEHPLLEAVLPFREARFQGIVPPVVSSASFAIRSRPSQIYRLMDYSRSGVMTDSQVCTIMTAIEYRQNVLIVGATGSGKTTMLNACLAHIAKMREHDRIVSIEDTMELQCSSPNYVSLHATGDVSMQQCLRAALRLRPTRIIVGEVRGAEALDLLKAWNTGHPGGLATVHANDALGGLLRIEALAREATDAPQQQFIAQTINVVVYLEEDRESASGRRVKEIKRVTGYRDGQYRMENL